ncbi:hypothetical protein BD413DRAFT_578951 [Trametes elegans]|nr:hypothetical protein BD413DRAFT_578951 [Trametes elegans]
MAQGFEANPPSLTDYLHQAYLPTLALAAELPGADPRAEPWPPIEELNMDYPRLVQKVAEIPLLALQNAVHIYLSGLGKKLRVDWDNTRLRLPCPGLTVLSPGVLARLRVDNEDAFLAAFQHFALETAAEAVRTIERCPFDEDELRFGRIVAASARSRERRLWTIWTFGPHVPPTSIIRPGIVILSIPPWKLGAGDMHEFASRRAFAPQELDRESPVTPAWSNATKLWAMLYDTCRVSGYRWFIVTTYQQWVFGTWSLAWTGAEVTAPVPFDRTLGMTVIEMLTFWIECARGKSKYWHLSADIPTP